MQKYGIIYYRNNRNIGENLLKPKKFPSDRLNKEKGKSYAHNYCNRSYSPYPDYTLQEEIRKRRFQLRKRDNQAEPENQFPDRYRLLAQKYNERKIKNEDNRIYQKNHHCR